MNKLKNDKLRSSGWKVGSASRFLNLSDEESSYLEIRLSLARFLKASREEQNLTQTQLAEQLSSSQSRIAKMEAGDPSVSIDLLIRALLHLGRSSKQLGQIIAMENN